MREDSTSRSGAKPSENKTNEKIEFRYYEVPSGQYVLPKLGPQWEMEYGTYAASIGHPGMLHFHNLLEVGYCYHGHGNVILSDRSLRYDDEEVFTIIPKNIAHTTNSDPGSTDKWEWLFIDIDSYVRNEMRGLAVAPDEILRLLGQRATIETAKSHPLEAQAIRGIIEECREQKPYYQECIKGYLRVLVMGGVRLANEWEKKTNVGDRTKFVERATDYIERHYADKDLKIEDIAAWCNISESYFRNVFSSAVGMKPNGYINMIRIDRACDLLLSTDDPIEKVGENVGYQNTPSFIRNFRALTGSTPLQWKKKMLDSRLQKRDFRISARRGWEGGQEKPRS